MSTAKQSSMMKTSEFIRFIADENDMTLDEAKRSYWAVVTAIKALVTKGVDLQLRGFGRFYLQLHTPMPDYLVLKFSASTSVNKHIRDGNMEQLLKRSDGLDG
mgnify:CR=1 FL=1